MGDDTLMGTIRNIEARVTSIEQYLPALATRAELQEAIAPLATRAELHQVRAELQNAIAELPTRDEMHAAIKAEGDRARHHATVLFEDLRDDNRIILEHLITLSARVDALASR
jgi:hypothetical protein